MSVSLKPCDAVLLTSFMMFRTSTKRKREEKCDPRSSGCLLPGPRKNGKKNDSFCLFCRFMVISKHVQVLSTSLVAREQVGFHSKYTIFVLLFASRDF